MVRILIQRSCYKCRADLLSLLVGVRSHTLFGVSCRDNVFLAELDCVSFVRHAKVVATSAFLNVKEMHEPKPWFFEGPKWTLRAGAEELYQLQLLAPEQIDVFRGRPCLFVQAQALEAGAEVSSHRDALPYGGDLIATVVLMGTSMVRVGHLSFEAREV